MVELTLGEVKLRIKSATRLERHFIVDDADKDAPRPPLDTLARATIFRCLFYELSSFTLSTREPI